MNIDNVTDKYYSDDDLTDMFRNIPPIAQNLMYKGSDVEINEGKEVEQKFEEGDICPICLDPLENGKELDFCRYSCGKTIHSKCFSMWVKSKGSICVFCRAQWYNANASSKNHKKVSMHPIGINNNNINNEEQNENNEENNEYNGMDLDKENNIEEEDNKYNNYDEENEDISSRRKKEKKKKKKNRSRSRNKSRSRSRSRSKDIKKNKKKKKNYNYPKD